MTTEQRFMFEERAAIMEYEGGLTRDEAERRAMIEVMNQETDNDQSI